MHASGRWPEPTGCASVAPICRSGARRSASLSRLARGATTGQSALVGTPGRTERERATFEVGDFTVRPSPWRVGGLVAFCLLGLWPALTTSAPPVVRIAGAVLALGFPLLVFGACLTRVQLRHDYLDVRTPGRRVHGYRSDISVESFSAGAGPSGRGRGLNFRDSSGGGVALVLHAFSHADQDALWSLLDHSSATRSDSD